MDAETEWTCCLCGRFSFTMTKGWSRLNAVDLLTCNILFDVQLYDLIVLFDITVRRFLCE